MKAGKLGLSLFLVIGSTSSGCVYRHLDEVIPTCNSENAVSFSAAVSPVIRAKCAIQGCHNGSNSNLPSLNTFSQIQSNSSDMLTQLSNHAMPPANKPQLTAMELAAIQCWINQGARTQ